MELKRAPKVCIDWADDREQVGKVRERKRRYVLTVLLDTCCICGMYYKRIQEGEMARRRYGNCFRGRTAS